MIIDNSTVTSNLLVTCPRCNNISLKGTEVCPVCGGMLSYKSVINPTPTTNKSFSTISTEPVKGKLGEKQTDGKLMWDRLPVEPVEEVVKVLTYGANKYNSDTPDNPNWKHVTDPKNKYYAAAMRHIIEWRKGNITDPESGLHHLAHAVSNLLFLMHFDLNPKQNKETN